MTTLRQFLDGRAATVNKITNPVVLPAFGVFIAMVFLLPFWPSPWNALVMLPWAVVAAGILWAHQLMRKTPCPRCATPLGRLGAVRIGRFGKRMVDDIGGCEACGLRMDEQIHR